MIYTEKFPVLPDYPGVPTLPDGPHDNTDEAAKEFLVALEGYKKEWEALEEFYALMRAPRIHEEKGPVMEEDAPEWAKEENIRNVTYSHGGYGGYVYDLGDGTCRFANDPLLGDDGPRWGDRVDLFEPWPCDMQSDEHDGKPAYRAFVGTRIIERYKPE